MVGKVLGPASISSDRSLQCILLMSQLTRKLGVPAEVRLAYNLQYHSPSQPYLPKVS